MPSLALPLPKCAAFLTLLLSRSESCLQPLQAAIISLARIGKTRTGTDGKQYPAPTTKKTPQQPTTTKPDDESDEIELVEEPVELTTAEFMAEWNKTINSGCLRISKVAKEVVDELQHIEGRELLDSSSANIFNDQLKAALQMLRTRKGHKECPHCEGDRCKRCDGLSGTGGEMSGERRE